MAASTMFPSPRATPPSALDTVPARRSLLATLIIGDAPAPHPAPSTRASQSARQLLYALHGARAMRPQGTSCHSSRVCHPSRRRVPERRSAASACAPHLATASPPRSQDEHCALLSAASPQLRRRRFARADPRARTGRIFVQLARRLRHVPPPRPAAGLPGCPGDARPAAAAAARPMAAAARPRIHSSARRPRFRLPRRARARTVPPKPQPR